MRSEQCLNWITCTGTFYFQYFFNATVLSSPQPCGSKSRISSTRVLQLANQCKPRVARDIPQRMMDLECAGGGAFGVLRLGDFGDCTVFLWPRFGGRVVRFGGNTYFFVNWNRRMNSTRICSGRRVSIMLWAQMELVEQHEPSLRSTIRMRLREKHDAKWTGRRLLGLRTA